MTGLAEHGELGKSTGLMDGWLCSLLGHHAKMRLGVFQCPFQAATFLGGLYEVTSKVALQITVLSVHSIHFGADTVSLDWTARDTWWFVHVADVGWRVFWIDIEWGSVFGVVES
jgi:hypothetical protein